MGDIRSFLCAQEGQELTSLGRGPAAHLPRRGAFLGVLRRNKPPLPLCFCASLPGMPSFRSPFIQVSAQMSPRGRLPLEQAQPALGVLPAPRHTDVPAVGIVFGALALECEPGGQGLGPQHLEQGLADTRVLGMLQFVSQPVCPAEWEGAPRGNETLPFSRWRLREC